MVVTPAPGAFNLTAATQGNSSIILNWSSSQDAATYVVKYGTVTGDYSTVASVNATSPYVFTGLINGVEYFFRVEAVNSVGSELSSSELSESVIFLDEFTTLDLITTWQLGDNPSSYSFTEWSQVYGGPGGMVFSSDGNNLTLEILLLQVEFILKLLKLDRHLILPILGLVLT